MEFTMKAFLSAALLGVLFFIFHQSCDAQEKEAATRPGDVPATRESGKELPQPSEKDTESGIERWLVKADEGDAEAQFKLAEAYSDGEKLKNDDVEAAKWYRKAAAQGYARAQYILGVRCVFGKGVPKDHIEAARWYRKAAEQGYALAQSSLGSCYENGQGVPQDHIEAARWYRKAAEQRHALAQFILGQSYEKGQGVPQDYILAYMWFNLAGMNRSSAPATDRVYAPARDRVAKLLTPDQLGEAQRLSREWHEKHQAKP